MDYDWELIGVVLLIALTVLWAKWSSLDLGLRRPAMKGIWTLSILYVAWIAVEQFVNVLEPAQMDSAWLQEQEQFTTVQYIFLTVMLGPIQEELLFRGALYSSILRRWGPVASISIPSVLWGVFHTQYGAWYMASIAGSGAVLALIRRKSGSIYVPLALHAGGNLLGFVLP